VKIVNPRLRQPSATRVTQALVQVQALAETGTIPQVLRERARLTPDLVAIRAKELGIYREITWADLLERVRKIFAGLRALGLQRGERVAIMGDPCWEWFATDYAILSAGAVSFGIYTTCSSDELKYQVKTGGARFFVAENQEYVDKFLAIEEDLPEVEAVIVFDTRGTFLYNDRRLKSFDELLRMGEERLAREPGKFDEQIDAGASDDTAILVYTSGTTGPPKAAVISHRNYLVGGGLTFIRMFPETTREEHAIVCHLPLAHAFERIFSLYSPLVTWQVIHIGESPELLSETLYEVQPTMFHGVPRIWEKMASRVLGELDRSIWIKRQVHRTAMAIGRRWLERRRAGKKPLLWEVLYQLARWISFRHILLKLGLHRCQVAFTAGAAIPPAVQTLWQIWGVDMRNLYGATEAAYMTVQQTSFANSASVGQPCPNTEVRLAEDGEIVVRSLGVFKGYLTGGTSEKIDAEGWLHTGDVGRFLPDGSLRLIDRKQDIMVTAGGKNITPSEIENLVRASPYVSEAVLIADGRKFPAMLVEIDYDCVTTWAQMQGITYTDYASLASHPRVAALIDAAIQEANRHLARVEQVKKFEVIPRELDPEYGDTTPTRKIKRAHFHAMFIELIEGMYRDEAEELNHIAQEAALHQEKGVSYA